jgi:hypothetical protein
MNELLAKIPDIIGMLGVGILLLTYFLLSTDKLSSTDIKYPLGNFIGAALVLFSLLFTFNFSSFFIECVWIMISLNGMYLIYNDKNK